MKRYKEIGRGFTLIEMMIVIAIIGILAAIAIPNLLRWVCMSRSTEARNFLDSVHKGALGYKENEDLQRQQNCANARVSGALCGAIGGVGSLTGLNCLGIDPNNIKPGRRYAAKFSFPGSGVAGCAGATEFLLANDVGAALDPAVMASSSNHNYGISLAGNIDSDPNLDCLGFFYDLLVPQNCRSENTAVAACANPVPVTCEPPPAGADCVD